MRYLRVATICGAIALALLSIQFGFGISPNKTVYAQAAMPSPTPGAAGQQQSVAQIGAIAQQVAQTVHDPSLSTDAKVQQVNALATQFNQLVAQWQQQSTMAAAPVSPAQPAPPVPVAGVQATPTPFGTPRTTTAPVAPPAAGAGLTADQLRAQIGAVTQQMAQVTQDATLTPEARTAQLKSLGTQFDQLMQQLQQLPQN